MIGLLGFPVVILGLLPFIYGGAAVPLTGKPDWPPVIIGVVIMIIGFSMIAYGALK